MTVYPKRGILYLGYRKDGKWIYKSTGLKDTPENRRKLQRFNYDEPQHHLLSPLLSSLVQQFLKEKHFLKTKTLVGYENVLKDVIKVIGDISIIDITPEHITQVQKYWQQHSHNTLASYNKQLKVFFNYLVNKEYIPKNFIPNIKYQPKTIRIIPDDVMDKILEKAKPNPKHYRLIYFLSKTGFRLNEALNLDWQDVDFVNKVIVLRDTKGNRDDIFPLTEELEVFLKSFAQPPGSVFQIKSLSWMRKKYFTDYTIHDIRRTYATHLLKNNINPYKVMRLLRHKDFATTMRHYAYVSMMDIKNDLDNLSNGKSGG